jgi:hypothetical protein
MSDETTMFRDSSRDDEQIKKIRQNRNEILAEIKKARSEKKSDLYIQGLREIAKNLLDDMVEIREKKKETIPGIPGGGVIPGGGSIPQTMPLEPRDLKTDRDKKLLRAKGGAVNKFKRGGLAEATARLKAQELSAGGTVIKTKTVAIDKSPNSGLITQRGFGASRRT